MKSSSESASSDVVRILHHATVELLGKSVYIRPLTPDECRRDDVIRLIQSADEDVLGFELYGVFDQDGTLIGSGSDRKLASESSIDHGFKPQDWLI